MFNFIKNGLKFFNIKKFARERSIMYNQDAKYLVCIDFDHTIVDGNSDTEIVRTLIPNGISYPPETVSLKFESHCWTEYMRRVFRFLHTNGVTQKDYYQCITSWPVVFGFQKLFEKLGNYSNFEVNIVSDANSVVIEHFLKANGLRSIVKNIYTNSSNFDKTGCLNICEYEIQYNCERCERNMCKGGILNKLIHKQESIGPSFEKIFYIGDGRNDVCPSLNLRYNDIVFARKNYALWKLLKKLPADKMKAKVVPWDTGEDILNALFSNETTNDH